MFSFTKTDRIGIYLDYSNMYYTKYTLWREYDISGFLRYCRDESTITKIGMYGAYDPKKATQFNRIQKLQSKYSSSKSYFYFKKLEQKWWSNKGNVDTEMWYDICEDKDLRDTIVLFTGDGDFLYIIDKLIKCGKQIVIISTKGHIAKELIDFIATQDETICRFIDIHKDNELTLPIKDILKENTRGVCIPPELYQRLQDADTTDITLLQSWLQAALDHKAYTIPTPLFLQTLQKRNKQTIASTILHRNPSEKQKFREYIGELVT